MVEAFTGNGSGNNNRMDTYSYDAAGNLLNDGLHSYIYDAESRIITVDLGPANGGTTYTYDALGRRVEKNFAGAITDYDYGFQGNASTESIGGVWTRSELYAGGHHVATYESGTTYFDHSDWLGTERARSDITGARCEAITSLPYGDGESISTTCSDPSTRHFTGKERDAESGLDMFGARYYGSSLGRFMTPDWAAKPITVPYANIGNPQSLNLYSYVVNNPATTRDLDGHSDYLWQKFKNSLEGKGWKTDAQVKGLSVAQTAQSHIGSKDWAINGTNTSGKDVGHPQVFKPGSDKCNQFVGDTLAEAGKTRPEIKDKDGNTRMPSAHEMADPKVHIPGLSDTKPLSEAQPGDVIAQEHGDTYGHSGIVATGSDGGLATVSANAAGSYGGQITQNDWGFRPAGQNGESSTDPAPVVRHPEDQ